MFENLLQLMTTAGNTLVLLTFLRWVQITVLNNSKPLIVSQPDPVPLFEVGSRYFDDIFDGNILKLSERLNQSEAAVVLFYAPWSRSSLNFKPIFESLAWKHATRNFEFIAINCWQPGAGTCRQAFSLRGGYPYISFFNHQTGHIFYNGVLSESEVLYFIFKFTYPFYSAADNVTLAGLRLLAPTSILIVVPVADEAVSDAGIAASTYSPSNFAQRSMSLPLNSSQFLSHRREGLNINAVTFKMGIRSVMVGVVSVFVPRSVFPGLTTPHFYMPDQNVYAVPGNWTGWLPPLKPHKIKSPPNNATEPESDPTSANRGIDRTVVAIVNSFLPSGPQFCNPSVALLKAASWLHGDCNTTTHDVLLSEVTVGLSFEEEQCKLLRLLSRDAAKLPPVVFPMLQNGGAELSRLSEITGLGCESLQRANNRREFLKTSFVATEHHAGAGVIFNHSASPATSHHIGPRRPLKLDPAIYLLDGRQESPVKIINASADQDAVSHLVSWLTEKYHDIIPDNVTDNTEKKPSCSRSSAVPLPNWLPCTSSPTLVYYEAPWCVFCSVLTPRIVVAAKNIKRAVPAFHFHRVTDADQVAEPSSYSSHAANKDAAATSSSVFSVPHYPALVFYPHGTRDSLSNHIPHVPISSIVPAVWKHMPLTDKLLACLFDSASSTASYSCWRRQLVKLRSLRQRVWKRQDELFVLNDNNFSGAAADQLLIGCPKRLLLLRFLSRAETLFTYVSTFLVQDDAVSKRPVFGAFWRLKNEISQLTSLHSALSNVNNIFCS